MIYEASLYYNKINAREQPRKEQVDQWRVFQTEQEAKEFIIRRARITLENAEIEMRRAKRDLARVTKRFGTPCKHGMNDPAECGLCEDERIAAANEGTND